MIGRTTFEHLLGQNSEDDRLERRIDTEITSVAIRGRDNPVHVPAGGWSTECVSRVLAKYRDAGWTTEFVRETRSNHFAEGDFIRLRAK